MRAQLILGVLVAGLLASCSSETGMIISTTTSDDFDGNIEKLRYYVGEENIDFRVGFSDRDLLGDINVADLDLGLAPYRLLLRPNGGDTGSIKVVAVSFDGQGTINGFGELPNMVDFVPDRVLQWDLVIEPTRSDIIVTDTDCVRWMNDEGEWNFIGVGDDQDCDGVLAPEDCNDLDPTVNPQKPEDCTNQIDDNCNGAIDDEDDADADNDGFPACGAVATDCNDNDASVNPNATEVCDGVDNDCDGSCDLGSDLDGDGVTTCGSIIEFTDPNGLGTCRLQDSLGPVDCNDDNEHVFPGNPERCDGIDNNCDGSCSDEDVFDLDGDGYTDCPGEDNLGSIVGSCWGTDPLWHDCNDGSAKIHPGAHDVCDGVDNNCDDVLDPPRTPCFSMTMDALGDNVCLDGTDLCSNGAPTGACDVEGIDRGGFDEAWCTSYTDCPQNVPTVDDNFTCSLYKSATTPNVEVCYVRMSSPGTMCPRQDVAIQLPFDNVAGCEYSVIGGARQQGYQLGFPISGSTVARHKIGCGAKLSVSLNPPNLWPGTASFSIDYRDTQNQSELQVQLIPVFVESCANLGNLECATWVAADPLPAP